MRKRISRTVASAHPRSRGENPRRHRSASNRTGSSPLTRGKPHVVQEGADARGLIPAHAGKTMTAIEARACRGAHPRSRGENPGEGAHVPQLGGSSPLTRGKLERLPVLCDRLGLIPAHAGKTPSRSVICISLRAHPRSRGENRRSARRSAPASGSSPLTRGKLDKFDHLGVSERLIPAHAGKTCD